MGPKFYHKRACKREKGDKKKMNEILFFATNWMQLETIMYSKTSQCPKRREFVFF